MNVQAAPSPYTPVGGSNMATGNPPVLGSQVPGTTGGLPALSGLSPAKNPMAEQLQSMGRGEDTMLIHMTPDEVNSLQGLAMAAGGSLTINPQTGLPEAGWLGKLLPTILGVAGAAFGIPTWAIGLGVGAGKTAVTGDLSKGLMAGLQAFGGAGLGQAAGLGGELGSVGQSLGLTQSATGAANAAGASVANPITTSGGAIPMNAGAPFSATLGDVATKSPGFLSKFGAETSLGQTGLLGKALPMAAGSAVLGGISDATAPKMPTYEEEKFNYVPMRMGRREVRFQTPEQMRESGGAEFSYFTPSNPDPVPIGSYAEGGAVGSPQEDFNSLAASYQAQNPGAITASMYPTRSDPVPSPAPSMGGMPNAGSEVMHEFNRPANTQLPVGGLGGMTQRPENFGGILEAILASRSQRPAPMGIYESPHQFAGGGAVDMRDGAFVVDARTVSELGNGSSNAGIEMLSRMGGQPVRGPGDGVSDSVKASIGGKQEARVARDEVIFQPEAVRRLGGGSDAKGTQKLYAMMDKAHKARKKAKRGQDTGLRRGLA
jgi:hypothetical protein